jgi:anti-sigma factor RsiW
MDLQEALEQIDRYVAGELNAEVRAKIEALSDENSELRRALRAAQRIQRLLGEAVLDEAPVSLAVRVLKQVKAEGRPKVVIPRQRRSHRSIWVLVTGVALALGIGLVALLPGIAEALGVQVAEGDVAPFVHWIPVGAALGFALFSVVRTLIHLKQDRALRRYAKQSDS